MVGNDTDNEKFEEDLNKNDFSEEVEELRAATAPTEPAVATFARALTQGFIERLKAETQAETGGWWRDVLRDENLAIALRGNSLDVYWLGARLFHVAFAEGTLSVSTHEKYLLNPALKDPVFLKAGSFDITMLKDRGFFGTYREGETLKDLKKAAGLYTDVEKSGCHEIFVRNSSVIDCEIAFPRSDAGRVDIAALEAYGDDVRLVFWEAKKFKNKELRSIKGPPPVYWQIRRYSDYVAAHQTSILNSYTEVTKNLVALHDMRSQRKEPPSALLRAVAAGTKRLVIGDTPKVGLLIFNYDVAQRDATDWVEYFQARRDIDDTSDMFDIIATGDPKNLRLPTKGAAKNDRK